MRKLHPYPLFDASSIDSLIDALKSVYDKDVDCFNISKTFVVNVTGNIAPAASGLASNVLRASVAFFESGKTILQVTFDNASVFVTDMLTGAGYTAFFETEKSEKPVDFGFFKPNLTDIWQWIKTISDISLYTPFFAPDELEIPSVPLLPLPDNDTPIIYDFIDGQIRYCRDITAYPDNRIVAGSTIKIDDDNYMIITCLHRAFAALERLQGSEYVYDSSNGYIPDLFDVNDNPLYRSGFTSAFPFMRISRGGIRLFWLNYSVKEDVYHHSIRVVKRWGKLDVVGDYFDGYVETFLEFGRTPYFISRHNIYPDSANTNNFDPSYSLLENNEIERSFDIHCHGIYISRGDIFDAYITSSLPSFPIIPFIPAIFLVLRHGGFSPIIIPAILSVIRTFLINNGEK